MECKIACARRKQKCRKPTFECSGGRRINALEVCAAKKENEHRASRKQYDVVPRSTSTRTRLRIGARSTAFEANRASAKVASSRYGCRNNVRKSDRKIISR